ncbi:hypothetical protein LJR231_001351 [Phyllobacterium sp. LjRoot231]|uniref:hypothetical protein n=1 Tax=Phyllobacterium sp. LjRoot231 TaxID=3342289 RepID=UPI003ECCCE6C
MTFHLSNEYLSIGRHSSYKWNNGLPGKGIGEFGDADFVASQRLILAEINAMFDY